VSSQKKKVATLCVVLLVGGGLVSLAARSTASEKTEVATPRANGPFSDGPSLDNQTDISLGGKELFYKMMFSVALIAGLAVAAFYMSRKVLPKVTHASAKEIRVVETTYLGPRRTLHLVQVGNQKLLIGSTNETITTLAHVGDAWLDLSRQELDSAVGS
jgi:flagellar biosynthetic protein FliO